MPPAATDAAGAWRSLPVDLDRGFGHRPSGRRRSVFYRDRGRGDHAGLRTVVETQLPMAGLFHGLVRADTLSGHLCECFLYARYHVQGRGCTADHALSAPASVVLLSAGDHRVSGAEPESGGCTVWGDLPGQYPGGDDHSGRVRLRGGHCHVCANGSGLLVDRPYFWPDHCMDRPYDTDGGALDGGAGQGCAGCHGCAGGHGGTSGEPAACAGLGK